MLQTLDEEVIVRHYEIEYLKKVFVATNATGIRGTINMSWPSQRLQHLNKSTYLRAHKLANLCHMSLSKLWEIMKDREAWHTAVHRFVKSLTRLATWLTASKKAAISVLQPQETELYQQPQVYLNLLYFTAFYKFMICGNSQCSKSIDTIFPIAFTHFLSL